MLQKWRPLLRWYVRELSAQFLTADCLSRAGALTYTSLFAVVPMMTVAYAMFSVLPEFSGVGDRIQGFLFENLVPDSGELLREKLTEFSERARQLTAVGFVFLFVTAFLMLVNVERAFNAIWQVAEPRRGLQRFLLYWGVLSLGPPLIAGGLIVSLYLISLPLVSDLDAFGLFELGKNLFTTVVRNSSIEPIYGTFAAVPLFLAWMYLVWVLVLSGAIFVRTLSLKPEAEEKHPEPALVKCARILKLLHDAHMEGLAVQDTEIRDRVPLSRTEHDEIFGVLQNLRLLTHNEDDGWKLGRDLKALTLWDLYQRLPDGLDFARLSRVEGMESVTEPLKSLIQFGSNEMTVTLDRVFGGAR